MMKRNSIVLAFTCTAVLLSGGIAFAQVNTSDSAASERTLRTEQQYMNEGDRIQDTTMRNRSTRDSIQNRMSRDTMRTGTSKTNQQKTLRDTSHTRTVTPGSNTDVKSTSPSGTRSTPQDVKSTTPRQTTQPRQGEQDVKTTTPPRTTESAAPQDKTMIKEKKPEPVNDSKAIDGTEKNKIMYLVPDSTAKKMNTPE